MPYFESENDEDVPDGLFRGTYCPFCGKMDQYHRDFDIVNIVDSSKRIPHIDYGHMSTAERLMHPDE